MMFSDHPLVRKSKWPVRCAMQALHCKPFFIIGNPRSGTTLLRAILSYHPEVFVPPENGALGRMIRTFGTCRRHPWRVVVRAVLEEFSKGYEFSHWKVDVEEVKRAAEALPGEERTLAGLIHLIYRTYGSIHAPGKTRWGDKTAVNVPYLGKIGLVFPDSRYIHMVRDGRDSIASNVKAGFSGGGYIRAAYYWKDNVRKCRNFGEKISSQNRFFQFRYEDLVSSPEKTVSALCKFLDLEPTETMLHYKGISENAPDVLTIAHHKNVIRPIFRDSIGKWKHQIPKSELRSVLTVIKKELAFFGYD